MKKWILIVFTGGIAFLSKGQAGASALIPAPLHVTETGGFFALTPTGIIITPATLL